MPEITLTDNTNAEFTVELAEGAPIAKYFKNIEKLGLPNLSFVALSNKRLDQVETTEVRSGLSFEHPVDVGSDQVEMKIKAGLEGAISLLTPDDGPIFDPDPFRSPIDILENQRFLSVALNAALEASVTGNIRDIGFGFTPSAEISIANYKPFTQQEGAQFPQYLDAIGQTLRELNLPGDLEDIERMAIGTVSTVSGRGSLKFSGKTSLFSVSNPLAVISSDVLPEPIGGVNVGFGGEIKIGASFEISGEYQVRVQKTNQGEFLLGYYKKRGTEFKLSMSGAFGVSALTGNDTDLFESLLSSISPDPQVDDLSKEALVSSGLTESEVGAMAKAIEASIQRTLELAIGLELESIDSQQEAFLFSIRIGQLNAAGRQAIHDALDGNLSSLINHGPNPLPGILVEKSILTEIEKTKHTVKVNLLGILNWGSVKTIALQHTVLTEPQTGEVTITDKATASTYNLLINNFSSDFLKLRRALVESFLISAVYQASGLGVVSLESLAMSHSYFELHSKTNRETVKDNLDAALALDLIDANTMNQVLDKGHEFGFSTFYISSKYDTGAILNQYCPNVSRIESVV